MQGRPCQRGPLLHLLQRQAGPWQRRGQAPCPAAWAPSCSCAGLVLPSCKLGPLAALGRRLWLGAQRAHLGAL